jgi:hypothetical protein
VTPDPIQQSRYEVWYHDHFSWVHEPRMTYRWRWLARLVAWEHTKRGWFRYEVRP